MAYLPNCESFQTYFDDEKILIWLGQAKDLDYDNWGERGDRKAPDYPEYEEFSMEWLPQEVIQEVVNIIWGYMLDIISNIDGEDVLDEIYIEWTQEVIKLTKPYWKIKTP